MAAGLLANFFWKAERLAVLIHGQRRAAGRIDADADDLVRGETAHASAAPAASAFLIVTSAPLT